LKTPLYRFKVFTENLADVLYDDEGGGVDRKHNAAQLHRFKAVRLIHMVSFPWDIVPAGRFLFRSSAPAQSFFFFKL
jgi:hypothetical protein